MPSPIRQQKNLKQRFKINIIIGEHAMYDLHIANYNYSSWSLRIWVLMKQLNIPFQQHIHFFDGADNRQQFNKFSPSATVPCLMDKDIIIWDSLAITEYLAEAYPQIWPLDKKARAWARCACAEMHASFKVLRELCSMSCGIRVELNDINNSDLKKGCARLDALWVEGLTKFGGPFLTGINFTAVDAFFAPVAFRIQTYGLKLSDKAMEYCQFLLKQPAMQEWYEGALREEKIDFDHEKWTLKHGKIIKDFRISH